MSEPKPTSLLDVRDLRIEFARPRSLLDVITRKPPSVARALNQVNLTIAPGETVGLVGESGSGKTTLGRALIQLYRPTAGEILYEGRSVHDRAPDWQRALRRQIQMVFQDPYSSLNPRMTVRQTLSEVLRFHKVVRPHEVDGEVARLLDLVGLPATMADRRPRGLSGGQRQRIGLARALAVRPKFLVLDEPVAALDVSIQAQILNLLASLKARLGLTMLFIAHELPVVQHVSDRIAVMYLGRIVEIGPADDVFSRPRHPYTQALLAAVPRLTPVKRARKPVLAEDVPSLYRIPSGCSFRTRCRYARDVCASTTPEMITVSPGHHASCHFARERLQDSRPSGHRPARIAGAS